MLRELLFLLFAHQTNGTEVTAVTVGALGAGAVKTAAPCLLVVVRGFDFSLLTKRLHQGVVSWPHNVGQVGATSSEEVVVGVLHYFHLPVPVVPPQASRF